MKKKLLGILLTAMLVVIAFTLCAGAATTISTADALIELMNSSAPATDWAGDYVLGKSIDLSTYTGELTQAPIGNSTTAFTGTFDGDGHTISGIDISTTTTDTGLFGRVKGNAVIENLTVYGNVSTSNSRGGGLIGQAYGGDVRVIDCTSYITVDATGGGAAGIVGTFALVANGDSIYIENCKNYGTVTGKQYNGGILGYAAGSKTGYSIKIVNCENHAAISTSTGNVVGGIFGYANITTTSGTNSFEFTGCANYGNLTCGGGTGYVGGIAGAVTGSANNKYAFSLTVSNCYNEGTVDGVNYLGGIIGLFRPMATGTLTVSDVMTAGEDVLSVIGGFGTATKSYTITRAYTTTGTAIYGVTGGNTINCTDCYTSESNAADLMKLAENSLWVGSEFGVELASFHDHESVNYMADDKNGHYAICLCLDESTKGETVAHTFNENGVCTVCAYTACSHPTTSYVVTKSATCTETGLKNLVCTACDSVLEADVVIEIDSNAHPANTTFKIKAIKTEPYAVHYTYTCCDAVAHADTTLATDIYVSTTGNDLSSVTGDVGETEATAFMNFEDAMIYAAISATANGNVTIHIVDKATVSSASYATPSYDGMITIKGGELAFASEATRFFQTGDLTVEDVAINNAAGLVWPARGHKIVMSTGITHTSSQPIYLLGGWQGSVDGKGGEINSDMVIRSGSWDYLVVGNRQGSLAHYGTSTLTIGKVDENDILTIGQFSPFHINGGDLSADSSTTIIVDGEVAITGKFYAGIHTTSSAVGVDYTFTVNYVLKEGADITSNIALTNQAPQSTIIWNVYADQDNEAGVADAARIVPTDNITVNNYTFKQYCATVLDHNGAESGICEECGADLNPCNHEVTEQQPQVIATCCQKGLSNVVCLSCFATIGTVETDFDENNHQDNTNFAWTVNAESGAYEVLCTACHKAIKSQTELPTVYVGTSAGNDENDGFTAATKVATLVEAVERIKNVGGTVRINGGVSISAHVNLPEWNGTITFTSDTYDSYGAATAGIVIAKQDVQLNLGGDAKFDAILFKGTSESVNRTWISANWHNVEFGYTRIQTYATCYLIAGAPAVKASDTTPADVSIKVDGPALSTNAKDYFFERIYLGSTLGVADIEVSNKKITLEVNDGYINTKDTTRGEEAYIYTLYTMTTSGVNAYASSTTNNCESIVTLNGGTMVYAFRTGDRNVSYDNITDIGPSGGKLDKLVVNLNDNSQITGSFHAKNVVNTTLHISDEEDGRTVPLTHTIDFYKYGTFLDTEATVTATYGTHSFDKSVGEEPIKGTRTVSGVNYDYVITENVTDECAANWTDWEITTEATPETEGVMTKTCTVCQRAETKSYQFACDVHQYVAMLDGTYYCAKDGEILNAPDAETIVALSPAMAQDGQVKVDVTVSANALWSAIFSVNAPAGFELADVSSALDGDFMFVGADELALPYSMAIMGIATDENGNLANGSIDEVVVTLTFNVTENVVGSKHVFTIVLDNVYDADGTEIGGEAVLAEVFACAHADTAVTTTATCTEGGVKTTVCNICNEVIESVEDGALGHDYESEVISTVSPTTAGVVRYTCKRCGDTYDDITLPAGSATLTAVAGQITDGKVSVELRLDADAVVAILFSVDVSDALTLESINDNASDNFYLEATELSDMPCKVMLVNLNGTNVALDNALIATLVFAVDEDALGESGDVILSAIECINADENDIYMHTVNATVVHNCKYECVFVADTAEKDAHYLYTCTVCGGTYEEVAVAQEYTASYGSTVILESDLGLQIVANIADKITDASKIWLIVESTDASGNVTREVVRPYQAYPQDKEQTAFIYRFNATRVSAKNIVDDIRVTLCVEKDGVKYAAPTVKSNIISYYAAAKNAGAPEAIINALDAMMNYGAAAQEYFKYSTDKLATSLTGAQKIDYSTDTSVSVNASTTYGDENITAYTYKSLSAVLEDKVVMVIKYNGAAADGLVFKGTYTDINGKAITFEKAAVVKSGVVTVEIDAIAAKDLRQAFTGALYNGDVQVSSSVTTSFEAYATQAINDIDNPKLNAVCRAALAYSDAAAAYFRTK